MGHRATLAINPLHTVESGKSRKAPSPPTLAAQPRDRPPVRGDTNVGHLLPLSSGAWTTQLQPPDPLSAHPGSTLGSPEWTKAQNLGDLSVESPFSTTQRGQPEEARGTPVGRVESPSGRLKRSRKENPSRPDPKRHPPCAAAIFPSCWVSTLRLETKKIRGHVKQFLTEKRVYLFAAIL